MIAEDVISKYYDTGSRLYDVLVQHGKDVAGMAIDIANSLPDHSIDNDFIVEASMLHDIGIFLVDLPELDCHGNHPYICHGHLGRELLENMGLPKHGLVCERHVGIGITIDDIKTHQLPLPPRDMSPITIEEQIICYADKFFSKNKNGSSRKKSVEKILQELEKYGHDKALQFQSWIEMFNSSGASEHKN
ncbi:MAG: phosphohydrolase [Deltaproteobacteria bacterium]|nr:phosphohydrolase [Deltaproteobacteria bacterium]